MFQSIVLYLIKHRCFIYLVHVYLIRNSSEPFTVFVLKNILLFLGKFDASLICSFRYIKPHFYRKSDSKSLTDKLNIIVDDDEMRIQEKTFLLFLVF